MTKRERFMNFLASKPVDRVPVAFFHHFCPPNEWGKGLENQEAFERNVIGHKLAREKFDPDVIKIMNDPFFDKNGQREAFYPTMMLRIVRSVPSMPLRARTPTLETVLSTSSARIPSPPLKSCPFLCIR